MIMVSPFYLFLNFLRGFYGVLVGRSNKFVIKTENLWAAQKWQILDRFNHRLLLNTVVVFIQKYCGLKVRDDSVGGV